MKIMMPLFIKYKYILLVIFICLFAILNLANYGIPPTHDGEYHVLRFQQFYKALADGYLFPIWAPDFNNGFGIPLFNYVYPLPNYIASFFHFLGFGFIDSFKLVMASASIVGAIFMFLWTKKYWGSLGGLVSSTFYTYSPYHLLDIYVRGSVGEVWALALAPGLYWSYLSFFEDKKKIFFASSAVLLSLIILSHNILALIFFIFFILYSGLLVYSSKNRHREIKYLGIIIILGLGMSAFFWLPAFLETRYVVGLQVFDPTKHFPQIYKLIYSSWGYGFSGLNVVDQMSFQIGIINLLAVAGSIVVLKLTKNKRIFLFLIPIFLFTVFLMTPLSSFIWKTLPFISYIQFPWRLLSLVILISSFLAGSLVTAPMFRKKRKIQILFTLLLIILPILYSINYAKAPFYHQRDDQHYLSRSNFTDGTNSPGNAFNTIWFNSKLSKKENLLNLKQEEYKIISNKSQYKLIKTLVGDNKNVTANIAYFPGWEIKVNNLKTDTNITKDGLIGFKIPKDESMIEIILRPTLIRKIALLISIFSILFLGLFMINKSNTIKK